MVGSNLASRTQTHQTCFQASAEMANETKPACAASSSVTRTPTEPVFPQVDIHNNTNSPSDSGSKVGISQQLKRTFAMYLEADDESVKEGEQRVVRHVETLPKAKVKKEHVTHLHHETVPTSTCRQ